MKELITQNYNHASIICWAISNEISLHGVTEDLLENHNILNNLIHKMDPSRVSAMANLFLLETDSPLVTLPDIRGYNLYYGWYVGEMEDNDEWFDTFHREHPEVVIGLTEYGADSTIRIQSPKPEKGDFSESYQALYHEHMLEMFSTRPYIWGTYCWNMFEFAAAGRDEAGDPGKNHKGLITFDRKTKKDAYYIYKAWWSKEAFVHLCGSRYHDRVEEVTEIKVYTNQPAVTLYVDGEEKETKEGSHVFTFEVPISGVHTIKAVSGECEDTMEIQKVAEPNPDYFASADKVRNWFDEPEGPEEKEGYLSLNSTMGEIQATEEGAALLASMMRQMSDGAAGGMGKGVQMTGAMQKMIARQPLKKLLVQGGMELDGDMARQLNAALNRIPKADK
jgi:beta-galactosidase